MPLVPDNPLLGKQRPSVPESLLENCEATREHSVPFRKSGDPLNPTPC
jgi:hypothetical protein